MQSSSLTTDTLSNPLDSQLKAVLSLIKSHAYLKTQTTKHIKIRINGWLNKLQTIVSNNLWRKNRNNYAKLLYVMLECCDILEPFVNLVPDDLPTLQKCHINCILMKLSTRVKERERDKQNKHSLSLKVDPIELWNSFESQKHNVQPMTPTIRKHQPPSNTQPLLNTVLPLHNRPTLSLQLRTDQNIHKKNAIQSISRVMDFLSPISQGMHVRASSNLSEYTYQSLQKCRDMISEGENMMEKQGRKAEEEGDGEGQGKEEQQMGRGKGRNVFREGQVKYFKKNRVIQNWQKQACTSNINCQEFTKKMLIFLKKHQETLKRDKEYQQIMEMLKHSIQLRKSKSGILQCSYIPIKDCTPSKHSQSSKKQQNFSLMQIDQNSYDYAAGKYSEYSSIQLDSGISPSRIKCIDETGSQDKFRRNPLEQCKGNIINGIPETISTFRKAVNVQNSRTREF